MLLEIRTKEGKLIGKIYGNSALILLPKLSVNECFESKTIKIFGEAPCNGLVCIEEGFITCADFEVSFSPGYYIKIKK